MISRKFLIIFVFMGLFIAVPSNVFSSITDDPPTPEALKPQSGSRIVQNKIADELGLPIIWSNSITAQLRLPQSKRNPKSSLKHLNRQLVLPLHSPYLITRPGYTYPWINDFLVTFGKQQYSATHRKLIISSFMRTVQRQRDMITPYKYIRTRRGKLKRIRNKAYNPNAAGFDSDHPELISLHCRAVAFDISRRNLTLAQIEWIRVKLIEIKEQDIGIFPIEERTPSGQINCFHIVIFDPVEYQKFKEKNSPVGEPRTAPIN